MHPHRFSTGPVTLAIVGAGSRGHAYARFAATHPGRARVVAVAEPRQQWRDSLVSAHAVAPDRVFATWEELAARPRLADVAIIATQDQMHRAPVEALAPLGYHILLEKPMAPTEGDCRAVRDVVTREGIFFAVCHVLLYTSYTRCLKSLLDGGTIGEVVSLQRLEPVGYWHQAHSFVRGNWRREGDSTFMLMSKACHDLDWMRHVVGRPCLRTSSFGNLKHFRPAAAPPGAAARCLDCPVEADCPYSAKRFYLDQFARAGRAEWVRIMAGKFDRESVAAALRHGPYGRCVYQCDNDVVDHQVVILEFEGGATASFTMTAFTPVGHRKDRVFGTRGSIEGDGERLWVYDFLSEATREIDTARTGDATAHGGHGGGDSGLMDAFVAAVAEGDRARIVSGADASLASHLMVFAAERARLAGTVESL